MKLSRGNASDINRVAIGCAPCSRVTPIPRVFGYGIFGASNFVTSRADGTIRGEIRGTEEEILSSFFFFFSSLRKRIIHLTVGSIVSLNANIYLHVISSKEERVASDRSDREEKGGGCKRSNVSAKRCVK